MPAPAVTPPPRTNGGLHPDSDRLYDFARWVTRDAASALEAVAVALAEAGGADQRGRLFGLVRREALARARAPAPPVLGPPVGADAPTLRSLMREAAGGLAPEDRAVLDLSLRQGLEAAELAEAMGVAPHAVTPVLSAARERADRLIGDYVLVRVAGRDCHGLASAVAEVPGDFEALSDRVQAHLAGCSACADRRRAMIPSTALLAQAATRPAPSRLRRRVLERLRTSRRHPRAHPRRGPVLVAAGALALGTAVAAAVLLAGPARRPPRSVPPGLLRASATTLEFGNDATERALTIVDDGRGPVRWRAVAEAPWVGLTPADGVLQPGTSAVVRVRLDRARTPEGDPQTALRMVSDAGVLEVVVHAHVERGPVVSKLEALPDTLVAAPCAAGAASSVVTASIVEESALRSVVVRWQAPGGDQGQRTMTASGSRYQAPLGPFARPGVVTWQVEATDSRGNSASSPPQTLAVVDCAGGG